MIIDSLIIFAAVIVFFIAWAEYGKKEAFGIVASCMLIVLGWWLQSSGIQIMTGQITTFAGVDNTTAFTNSTGATLQNSTNCTDIQRECMTTLTEINLSDNETTGGSTTFGHTETTSNIYTNLPATPGPVQMVDFLTLICILAGIGGLLYYSLQPWGQKVR